MVSLLVKEDWEKQKPYTVESRGHKHFLRRDESYGRISTLMESWVMH